MKELIGDCITSKIRPKIGVRGCPSEFVDVEAEDILLVARELRVYNGPVVLEAEFTVIDDQRKLLAVAS